MPASHGAKELTFAVKELTFAVPLWATVVKAKYSQNTTLQTRGITVMILMLCQDRYNALHQTNGSIFTSKDDFIGDENLYYGLCGVVCKC